MQYLIQSIHEFDMYDILASIISEFQSVFYIGREENTNLCSLGPLYNMLLIEVDSLPEIFS